MLLVVAAIKSESDRDFIEQLYIANYPYMKSAVRNILYKSPNLEDVIADAVISLIGKISLLRSMSVDARRKYIVVTARNAALQDLRRNGNKKRLQQLGFYDAFEHLFINVNEPLDCLLEKESVAEIREALSKLKAVDQMILYYIVELDYDCIQIAKLMNLSHPACRTRLSRARKKLHDMWKRGVRIGE